MADEFSTCPECDREVIAVISANCSQSALFGEANTCEVFNYAWMSSKMFVHPPEE